MEWIKDKNREETLKISTAVNDIFKELQDCIDDKKLKLKELENIDSVIVFAQATRNERKATGLLKQRKNLLIKVGMLTDAIKILESKIANA